MTQEQEQEKQQETIVTYEDLKKAALIEQKIYFMERTIMYKGMHVTCVQLLDQDNHEIRVFNPGEEDGVSKNVPSGIQPQFCQFRISVVESHDEFLEVMEQGEAASFSNWRPISLKELHELWASCL